jgi:hypothetical protein
VPVEVVVALIGGGFAVLASSVGVVLEVLRRLWRRNVVDHAEVLDVVRGLGVGQREVVSDVRDLRSDVREVRADVRELSEDHLLLRSELSDFLDNPKQ